MASLEISWVVLVIVGVLSGALSGTFGVGAAFVLIPALVFMGSDQKDAQGVALAVMVPMALMGAWRYHRSPGINLDLRIALIIGIASLAGAWIGAHFAGILTGDLLGKLFAGVMILVAIQLLRGK
jgi:uncharacterized membrane protein YfcA